MVYQAKPLSDSHKSKDDYVVCKIIQPTGKWRNVVCVLRGYAQVKFDKNVEPKDAFPKPFISNYWYHINKNSRLNFKWTTILKVQLCGNTENQNYPLLLGDSHWIRTVPTRAILSRSRSRTIIIARRKNSFIWYSSRTLGKCGNTSVTQLSDRQLCSNDYSNLRNLTTKLP